MTKRKQTPDVLAAILGGNVQTPEFGSSSSSQLLSPEPEEVAPIRQWEYRIVTFQEYKGWRPRFVNGQEFKEWMNGPVIHDFIAQMGNDGWNLTAASSGEHMYGSADKHQLFFKRLQ